MLIIEDKKALCLYTGSYRTKAILCRQLQEVLGKGVNILSYAVDEEETRLENTEITILSSNSIEEELLASKFLKEDMDYLVCGRRINFDYIENVLRIPKGQVVLVVNDTKETAELCIQNLLDIGIDHIQYDSYYPGTQINRGYSFAITAGEKALVPAAIKHIIDLGPRLIDMPSLLKIADLLRIHDFDTNKIIKPYTDKIIDISKKMVLVNAEVEGVKHLLKQKLESKGHTACYTFDSIKGNSQILLDVKQRAKKLAKTDLTILIEGESGTGKELFASAIHNGSSRKDGPYLAVNFSALPEELVESTLFGYEEGAFTGAKKGGKTGLFEQADGGTIFLDEIGDISQRMQTKLLRVLQEKEIMPVGGGNIKKVNIRVIAATNKDLKNMVNEGLFRDDLFYRLKIGYVNVPALRKRKEDIRCMVHYFAEKEGSPEVSFDDEVYDTFNRYDWRGNVRELKNTIKYMLAIRENSTRVTALDLPDGNFFEEAISIDQTADSLNGQMEAVLDTIYKLSKTGINVGRNVVSEHLNQDNIQLSENQVRKRIKLLWDLGFVEIHRGKLGTSLTEKGRQYVKERINRENENNHY